MWETGNLILGDLRETVWSCGCEMSIPTAEVWAQLPLEMKISSIRVRPCHEHMALMNDPEAFQRELNQRMRVTVEGIWKELINTEV